MSENTYIIVDNLPIDFNEDKVVELFKNYKIQRLYLEKNFDRTLKRAHVGFSNFDTSKRALEDQTIVLTNDTFKFTRTSSLVTDNSTNCEWD